MGLIDKRLKDLGIELLSPRKPVANYEAYVNVGNLVYISGQIPMLSNDIKYIGKLGVNFTIEEGAEAAKLCGINILSQLKAACDGDLDRVERCIQLMGFVNSTDDFEDHPKVINGCSDLMIEVFKDKGKHSRAAVGASSLPLGVAVEVSAVFTIKI